MRRRLRLEPAAIIFAILVRKGLKPVLEYRFHPTRKWRFDVALPEQRIAIEVEGGIFIKQAPATDPVAKQKQRARMAHASPMAILRDIEKYNEAQFLGWRVFRTSTRANDWARLADRVAEAALGDGQGG